MTRNIPWDAIRQCYEAGEGSAAQLAARFGVTARTIGMHIKKEKWRRDSNLPGTAEGCLSSAVRQLAALLRRFDTGEEVPLSEIKELTAILKELMRLREMLGQMEATNSRIEVVMDEEVEAWSR